MLFQSLVWEDPLEIWEDPPPGEGNDIHSSIPAWEIPWTEETGGL